MLAKIKKKPKILIIGGPTASGKSALSIRLAQKFGGEIIGADSMQIYRGMDIGTGKTTITERGGIKHRLIDIIEPNQSYSVGQYRKDAEQAIADILQNGKLPIIVGGTGLYINSIVSGYSFSDMGRNEEFRLDLQRQSEEFGIQKLYDKLNLIDPISAQRIMPNDLRRIIRALEICEFSGKIKSEQSDNGECSYDYFLLIIKTDREKLYQNINNRVDRMLLSGLIDEVRGLGLTKEYSSMNAIGYKETFDYLAGKQDKEQLDKLSENIKTNTRHYAKRQITYFKNVFKSSEWVFVDDFDYIDQRIYDFLK